MASSSTEQTSSLSGSTLWRRPVTSAASRPPVGNPLRPDVEPQPKPPRPVFQLLAFGLFLLLACLQFLPATHFRHPADPLRNWIPFGGTESTSTNSRSQDKEKSSISEPDEEAGKIHLFSWANCFDIRMFAVLANSTLSNSRLSENVHFHFFIPDDEEVKSSYYKLKVLFPKSNLDIIEHKDVKVKLSTVIPDGELLWPLLHELAPLVIPSINPWKRSIYISPDTIIQGKIEELFGLPLDEYAIAVAEDCGRRLGDSVNMDVVNAIQRTASKTWVSEEPYAVNACTPVLSVVLHNANKSDKNLVEAILWWSRALNLKNERSDQVDPAITLALYGKYLKLPSAWTLGESAQSKMELLVFDGPRKVCSGDHSQHQRSEPGNIWQNYLPPNSDAVLSH